MKDAKSSNINRRKLFQSILRKYPNREDWKWEILENDIADEDMDDREKYWIERFDTIKPNGLNLREGGSRGRLHPDTKDKLSKSSKEYFKTHANPMLGRKHSPKAIEIMTQKRIGTTATEETKRKMSIAHKGKKLLPFSEEHRRKLADSKTGEKHPFWGIKRKNHSERMKGNSNPNVKKVRRESDGKVFESIMDACKETGYDRSSIWKAINKKMPNGERRKTAGSYWSYAE